MTIGRDALPRTEFDERLKYEPIPLDAGSVEGWKSIEIRENGEQLVPLGPYSAETGTIPTSSVYFGEHNNSPYILEENKLDGSFLTMFVRETVASRLMEARQYLPDTYRLIVFDAYRSLQVQDSLFRLYLDQLRHLNQTMGEEDLIRETQKYVSIPSADPSRPSPHNTGGSVDLALVKMSPNAVSTVDCIDYQLANQQLSIESRVVLEMKKSTIIRREAQMLEFGTPFDHGGNQAAIAYYEQRIAAGEDLSHEEIEACNNRRLLYEVMTRVGMQAYGPEWWHFNAPESQMGAATARLEYATYGAATLSMQNVNHEVLRKEVHERAVRIQENRMGLMGEMILKHSSMDERIASTLEEVGEPRITGHWPVEIIAPQR